MGGYCPVSICLGLYDMGIFVQGVYVIEPFFL